MENAESKDLQFSGISFHKVMMGKGLKGFVYVSSKGRSHIFVDESLSPRVTIETVAHELFHIHHDELSFGIGLDRQQEESEKRANAYAVLAAPLLLTMAAMCIPV